MSNNGSVHSGESKAKVRLKFVKVDRPRMILEWPKVRLGCLMLKNSDKYADAGNWDETHVRAQLEMGYVGRSSCELFSFDNEQNQMQGFVVTIIGNCPYKNTPNSLISWIMYAFRPVTSAEARAMIREVENYAKQCGLNFHDTYTIDPRIALWLQRYGKGYRVAQTLMRKSVWESD